MPIVPDTKNWTWVLQRPCLECGFDASTLPRDEVAPVLRDTAERFGARLERTAADQLTRRPSDDRWSALEYACHVRDVCRLYAERLALMLAEDDPTFPNWDQDGAAVEDRYNEQDPATVTRQLIDAANRLADSFDRVTGSTWERTGWRSDGVHFTIDTFARYMVHDPVHHLRDVIDGLDRLT